MRDFNAEMAGINNQLGKSTNAMVSSINKVAQGYDNEYTANALAMLGNANANMNQFDLLASRAPSLTERTALESALESSAHDGVMLGRSLSPEQIRDAQQQARTAFAARGNLMGNAGLAAEVLNRDRYASDRYNERMQLGMGTADMLRRNEHAGWEIAGNFLNQNQQNWTGMAGAYASLDPYSRAVNSGVSQGIYNGLLNYGNDLYNTNNNAQWSEYYNKQNKAAAGGGGWMVGAAGGAMSGAVMGSSFGPWGTAIGAVVGGVAGGVSGHMADKNAKK